jgi:hypothetical protein
LAVDAAEALDRDGRGRVAVAELDGLAATSASRRVRLDALRDAAH